MLRNLKLRNRIRVILILAIIHILFRGPARAGDGKIAILMSRHIAPFNIAMKGFQETVDCPCQILDLAMDETSKDKIIREITYYSHPRLILAIGSSSLHFALKNFSHFPIVFTMVSNPSRIIKSRKQKISGVRMETPWDVMFKQLAEIAPRYRRVGIILNPKKVEESTEEIRNLALKHGLKPVLRAVNDASGAISVFKDIEDQIDAFLMVPDPYIFTKKFYEYILLASLRYKFVLIGLSPKYTKAGSLFSVMGDNRDWGVQAALIANKILNGTKPGLIPYGFAQKYSLSINLKTAEKVNIKIPRSIKQKADIIVR